MTVPVSIVIPILDEAKTLPELLDALERQTVSPQEVIFVDAGSKDEGRAIINSRTGENYKILDNLDVFPGAGRNVGIKAAKGEWIAFLDVGIVPEPEWLKALFDCVNAQQGEGVFGICRFSGEGVIGRAACALSYGHGMIREDILPGSLFNKKVFAEEKGNVGLFRPDLRAAEDTLWKDEYSAVYPAKHVCRKALVNYTNFPNSFWEVLLKWFCYSSNQARAGVQGRQRALYLLGLSGVLTSTLFFDIKTVLLVLVVAVFVIRGLLIPMTRSISWHWWKGEPLSLVAALPLSLVMDLAKGTGFLFGYLEKATGKRFSEADRANIQS